MSDLPLERPYSPQLVEAELHRAGFFRASWRVLQIASVFLMLLVWRARDRWGRHHQSAETVEQRQRRRATWLFGRIAWLGPTFVKVGQSLATRPDLLPLPYIQVLSRLHDQLPPFDDQIAFAVIETDLGWRPETLFRHFEREPFAAASLGQVYHAITYGGMEVAVKVQRPDVARLVSLDLALVRRLAVWIESHPRLGRGQPWVGIVDEFGTKLFEELDYVHEAHLTERFRANIAGLAGVYAPQVQWSLTGRRVLTTEFVSGIKITDKEALLAAGIDIRALLSQGIRANLKQLFEDGFFHADPHPGNLLVRPEDGALVFLDFGMMGIILPSQKERIVEIFVDVLNRRPDMLKGNLIALGCLRPEARWDELMPLAEQMFRAVLGDREKNHTLQELTSYFAPLIYEYEFRIPLDLAYIVRALTMLEGIARQLDPAFDIFSVSAPYAARMMLTSPSPSLRRRLMDELLTAGGKLDWDRLDQLAALATRDANSRIGTQGLLGPALDMLLSREGDTVRRAIVDELLSLPANGDRHRFHGLASLLESDPEMSGRTILDRIVAFLLSPEGAETRGQIESGLRGRSGKLSWMHASSIVSAIGQLHPDFGLTRLLGAAGRFLLSRQGQSARSGLVEAGKQWAIATLQDRKKLRA